ncbi:ATP-dependent DNA helicase [Trichonephila clavipes]|nr:ATP-dependent DNA helicase [Trichonephila clavipes]
MVLYTQKFHTAHLPTLDLVSEKLISPRIPFMQIRRLRHVRGQFGILGQIINVPVSVNTMVNRLPRNVDDDYCVNVHIKRRKIHRTSYLMGLVTKRTIKAWLQYLVATPLYRMYDVTIDDSFFNLNQSTYRCNFLRVRIDTVDRLQSRIFISYFRYHKIIVSFLENDDVEN